MQSASLHFLLTYSLSWVYPVLRNISLHTASVPDPVADPETFNHLGRRDDLRVVDTATSHVARAEELLLT
jgi:hypothetical protein